MFLGMMGILLRWSASLALVTTTILIVVSSTSQGKRELNGPGWPAESQHTIAVGDAPLLGSTSSPAVVIEFSDFRCNACRQFATRVFPVLQKRFVETGLVSFAFKFYPLDSSERTDRSVAAAGVCAWRHKRFWQLHHLLFAAKPPLTFEGAVDLAVSSGIGREQIESCLLETPSARIAVDVALGNDFDLEGTPLFLLGLRDQPHSTTVRIVDKIVGTITPESFGRKLEAILNR